VGYPLSVFNKQIYLMEKTKSSLFIRFGSHTFLFLYTQSTRIWKVFQASCSSQQPPSNNSLASLLSCFVVLLLFSSFSSTYEVATDSRIDKIIGLFCRIMSLLQGSLTTKTYYLIDPTNQSHPILNVAYSYAYSSHGGSLD